jgi:hypothetical protein
MRGSSDECNGEDVCALQECGRVSFFAAPANGGAARSYNRVAAAGVLGPRGD